MRARIGGNLLSRQHAPARHEIPKWLDELSITLGRRLPRGLVSRAHGVCTVLRFTPRFMDANANALHAE